jgi:hypothetical protein
MIREENKVGAALKNGTQLDYGNSRKWDDIILVAIEDLENGNNDALDILLSNIISDKKYEALTGGIRETLPFERSELEGAKIDGMTNTQKNSRLVSNKKREQITEEFWENEFKELKVNVLNDYELLKNSIVTGKIRIKPSSQIRKKLNFVSRIFNAITSNKLMKSRDNKSKVISYSDENLPVATKIHFAHAEYVSKKLKKYREEANIESKRTESDVLIPSIPRNLRNIRNKFEFRR